MRPGMLAWITYSDEISFNVVKMKIVG